MLEKRSPMLRVITRILLGFALVLSLGTAGFSIFSIIKCPSDATWAVLAAALAVVTSIISAWGALRVIELEEDKLCPNPYPHFDTTSRYGLMLLRVTNSGGGAAYNIDLIWDEQLVNSRGEIIRYSPDRKSPEIPVLLPGESVSKTVDGYIQFFGMQKRHEYSGDVKFTDGKGRKFKRRFVLDAEMYKGTPYYSEEELKTHYELQKLPSELQKLTSEVTKLQVIINNKNKKISE